LRRSFPTSSRIKREELSASSWNLSLGKRSLDLAFAVVLLTLSSPLLLIIAMMIKCTSSGPIFFRQTRVGRNGVPFTLLKFRSMTCNAAGPALTRGGDQRITRIGRLLRKYKLDELPQLMNVVLGQMSLVGPRPDLQKYITQLPADLKQVLQLLPGVTGAASLRYRREESLLSQVSPEDLDHVYCSKLLPHKIQLDLEYAHHATLCSDLGILLQTAGGLFTRGPESLPAIGTIQDHS
jgi:lipopolysaccharide/colanic/teichoic acid biosynthesis glycosyltransferase